MSTESGQVQSAPPKSVVARALSVLSVFSALTPAMSLGKISEQCGLPMATTFRMLKELVAGGFLERSEDGTYQLGMALWQMGLLAPVHRQLRETALPYLLRFQQQTQETVQLAVISGLEAVYVEKLSLDTDAPSESRIGARIPLHATGVGKALLASSPPTLLNELSNPGLKSYTENTIIDFAHLQRELEGIRAKGYAVSDQEFSSGATSLAGTVRQPGGTLAAVGLVNYHRNRHLNRHASALAECLENISSALIPADHSD